MFFCLAINLADLNDLKKNIKQADTLTKHMNVNEKSDTVKKLLNEYGAKRNITIKLKK